MQKWTAHSTKVLIAGLVLIALLFFGGITYYSVARLNRSKPSELVVLGKQVWKQKSCVGCHTISGSGSYLASDLTHAVSSSSPDVIESFLSGSQQRDSARTSSHPVLNEDEIEAIVQLLTYVDQLNAREIMSLDMLESFSAENANGGKDNLQ